MLGTMYFHDGMILPTLSISCHVFALCFLRRPSRCETPSQQSSTVSTKDQFLANDVHSFPNLYGSVFIGTVSTNITCHAFHVVYIENYSTVHTRIIQKYLKRHKHNTSHHTKERTFTFHKFTYLSITI